MIGHMPPRSPRERDRELGWVGVGGGVSAAATARVNGIARPREYVATADPHSRFYDGRSDPNSKWYDPEHDPNSRWFRGAPQPATPEPGSLEDFRKFSRIFKIFQRSRRLREDFRGFSKDFLCRETARDVVFL